MAFVATMDTRPPLHSSFQIGEHVRRVTELLLRAHTSGARFCIIVAVGMAAESKGRACRLAVVRSASISALPLDQTISLVRVESDP